MLPGVALSCDDAVMRMSACRELGLVAYVSAMTVAHGGLPLYASKAAQLGPDPLREDADKEVGRARPLLLASTHVNMRWDGGAVVAPT